MAPVAAIMPGSSLYRCHRKDQDGSRDRRLVYDSLELADVEGAEMPAVGRIAAVTEALSIDLAWMPTS